jgi:dihydrofolate synthase / folylpolyglutamate synthase
VKFLLSFHDWLSRIEKIHAKPIDMGLERVKEVASRLGLFDVAGFQSSAKIVVAGTNGKGSTCAMLEAILLSSGYKVATYTSPHLIDFT